MSEGYGPESERQWEPCVDRRGVVLFFFFQAEDGIRDLTVTGVQTCALPISSPATRAAAPAAACGSPRSRRRRRPPAAVTRTDRRPTAPRDRWRAPTRAPFRLPGVGSHRPAGARTDRSLP